ncbi:hypothetical protein SGLAM104S_00527 [Streptomyces glaucescens]
MAHGAVVAHQVAEEDDVDRLLVRGRGRRRRPGRSPGCASRTGRRGSWPASPETHAHRVRLPPSFFCRLMAWHVGHVDGHALIPSRTSPVAAVARLTRTLRRGTDSAGTQARALCGLVQAQRSGGRGGPEAPVTELRTAPCGGVRPEPGLLHLAQIPCFISETSSRSRAAISNWRISGGGPHAGGEVLDLLGEFGGGAVGRRRLGGLALGGLGPPLRLAPRAGTGALVPLPSFMAGGSRSRGAVRCRRPRGRSGRRFR